MRVPNVVGTYVGLCADGKALCIHVMLSRDTRETRSALPKTIAGYGVVVDVSGEIRPLK